MEMQKGKQTSPLIAERQTVSEAGWLAGRQADKHEDRQAFRHSASSKTDTHTDRQVD